MALVSVGILSLQFIISYQIGIKCLPIYIEPYWKYHSFQYKTVAAIRYPTQLVLKLKPYCKTHTDDSVEFSLFMFWCVYSPNPCLLDVRKVSVLKMLLIHYSLWGILIFFDMYYYILCKRSPLCSWQSERCVSMQLFCRTGQTSGNRGWLLVWVRVVSGLL